MVCDYVPLSSAPTATGTVAEDTSSYIHVTGVMLHWIIELSNMFCV